MPKQNSKSSTSRVEHNPQKIKKGKGVAKYNRLTVYKNRIAEKVVTLLIHKSSPHKSYKNVIRSAIANYAAILEILELIFAITNRKSFSKSKGNA